MSLSRRLFLALGGAAVLAAPAGAYGMNGLYRGRTIVTGRRAETRIPGMVRALSQVLVRVSGDPRLARHPKLQAFSEAPEAAVTDYTYRDLYAFRPIRDEQGTRDRPYEMTVRYDPLKIDRMLAEMGSRPWLAPRPRLLVVLAVHHIASDFLLTTTGDSGELMRQSFTDAAWNAAMEVVIAPPELLAQAGVSLETAADLPLSAITRRFDAGAGEVPLAGVLRWSKELLAWKAAWRLPAAGGEQRWAIAGVNFDAAFRSGVGGAAQVLSGNGTPA